MSLDNVILDFDLNGYFSRIGLEEIINEKIEPSLDLLSKIQLAHMSKIPFENLDVVAGKVISMSAVDVHSKLVIDNRGGYCFEQNTLLRSALVKLGYIVRPFLSRVRWGAKVPITPLTHIVLGVTIPSTNVEYLVDVGFGGLGSNIPLRIDTEEIQSTDEKYRILPQDDNYYKVQWYLNEVWSDLYCFLRSKAIEVDCVMSNWWSCTYALARWKTCLFVSMIIGDCRHRILNGTYTIRNSSNGSVTNKLITDINELFALLTDVFHINYASLLLPDVEDNFKISCQRFLEIDYPIKQL